MPKIAIVQTAPVFLDKKKTIEKMLSKIDQAAAKGATLIVFSEAFIPGYPAWVWRLRPGGDWDISEQLHQRLLENAVSIDSDDLAPLYKIAKKYHITLVFGIDERENRFARTTLYNSVVTISQDGELINHHRKLMPTNPERMVWGFGDATGLKVVETPAGRIGSLLCWENFMPLARYALYAQGVEIYIAPTYDSGDDWINSLRHIAREGGCWVIGCGNLMRGSDIPADLPDRENLYPDPDEWVNPGDSVVISPTGQIVAGPLHQQDDILLYSIDIAATATAKRTFDVTGHYSRPDIFQLQVNSQAQTSIQFD